MSAPHYMVFEVDLKTDDWVPAYQEGAPPVLADYGGKYLALTPSPERLEGNGGVPTFMAIVEFPDKASADGFYHSDGYRPHRLARLEGADNNAFSLAGMVDA